MHGDEIPRQEGRAASGLALVVMPENAPDRAAVLRVVERMGFRIEDHHDAGTALEAVEYTGPGLVVHAWDLPDMDGATFHDAVQRRAGGRRVPTLAIMPADRNPDQHVGAQTGIMEYICRPFQDEALRSRLSGLLIHLGRPAERKAESRKEPEMIESTAPARPAKKAAPRSEAGRNAPNVRFIGLGEWGIRGAEILAERGVSARGVDTDGTVDRARLEETRRHRVALPADVHPDDWAGSARALAGDPGLGGALAADADADLIVVGGDLAAGSGALLGALLRRVARDAPRAGRLAVARLPGLRSGPDQRALALVALNAVLQTPESSVLLLQPPDGTGSRGADAHGPLARLADLWAMTADDAEAFRALRWSALWRLLATPGFIGWREMELEREDCAEGAGGWHAKLAGAAPHWQPEGFQWAEAQGVLAAARAPEAWLEAGGLKHFDRLVQEAWDEAAPCAIEQGLFAAEQPARAFVLSVGMPYPKDVLALRDSVEADRARLAEKRRAAESLIPLGEDFLPRGAGALMDLSDLPAARAAAPRPEPAPESRAPEPAPRVEAEPEPEPAPRVEAEPVKPEPEPAPEPVPEPEPEPAPGPAPVESEPAARVIDIAEPEPGTMPPAYETALELTRRILGAEDLRAEADLGEVRYALYDMLEVLREEPESILPEVFRPTLDDWFARHHVNVAILTVLAADRTRGSLSEVIDLGTAALLHDVGMMATREIWDSPVRLSEEEFERSVRSHPEEGFRRLQDVPGMTAPIARTVLEEHERMDGTGYPEGLVGDAIDPGARILAACDMLEALTHPRPHRGHAGVAEALGRLEVLGEHTLDAAVVDALVDELGRLLGR